MKQNESIAIEESLGTSSKIIAATTGFKTGKYTAEKAGKLVNDALIAYGIRCFDKGYKER